jgi:hypothetical protein
VKEMEINEIIPYVFNNGVAVVLIFYYLKNNNSTIKELTNILIKLVEQIEGIAKKVESCDKNN